ncbi:MAG: redoxin domain-containing protein [Planctomycetota bacterium]
MPPTQSLPLREGPIAAGDPAPDFTLMDQDKQEWTLSERLKERDVVLCFYPMDFSPVCETEMKCVQDDFEKFAAHNAEVVGISTDSFFTHKAWADSLGLQQTLLADMHRAVCRAYGFYFEPLNVSARGTVIVGKDGFVKWVQAREIGDAMALEEVVGALV